jgi:hypothetical protein
VNKLSKNYLTSPQLRLLGENIPVSSTGDIGISDVLLSKLPVQNKMVSLEQLYKMDLKFLPDGEDLNYEGDYLNNIKKYADYTKIHGVKNMPPIRFMDSRLEDGSHRLNTLLLLSKENPKWLKVLISVQFFTSGINWEDLEKKDPNAFISKSKAGKYIQQNLQNK